MTLNNISWKCHSTSKDGVKTAPLPSGPPPQRLTRLALTDHNQVITTATANSVFTTAQSQTSRHRSQP